MTTYTARLLRVAITNAYVQDVEEWLAKNKSSQLHDTPNRQGMEVVSTKPGFKYMCYVKINT